MARNKRLDYIIDNEKGEVTATVLESGTKITAALSDFSDEIVRKLALHGLKQKMGDSAAAKDAPAETNINNVVQNLKDGNFVAKGTGGGGKGPSDLYLALAEAAGVSLDEASNILDAMTAEQRKEVPKQFPQVGAIMADMRAKRAQEKAKAEKAKAKGADADISSLFNQ